MNYDDSFSDNTTRALTQIRRLIDDGNLPSDGRLPTERELSETYGFGRRTVRRALEVLEAEGLLWRRQGKGTFAGQPPRPAAQMAAEIADEVDALGVMEARMGIEPQLAALCARRASGEDVDRLRLLADRTYAAADSDSSELWDGAIHRLIARIAGNPLLLAAFDLLDTVRMGEDWQHKRHMARSEETRAIYHAQHEKIIAAIDARDSDRARAAMMEHLQVLTDNMRRTLEDAL
ncbi:FadR/GntR family transcriptional regulator [Yoonia sediminilitoris]|uniref:GntR family transcriptional regulator n=1 Tax=Yoonia sediminilitoris TaxID=1286148 RepID=A0A2T6KRF7_9RHOB|nr:FCD domain-containing protein [Yoonia sediminilitoris]PUB19138.1 GntR family transcriptional regulator [Yoonia sediminilitoris]RCW99306.1 GntR family transcriptional regulator [Yoonia sediminilitoris]